ncbi:MAG TPA: autotransporter-associated beta strand repeat-containing protein [Kiritimatiellia bacterium]|nr:autotransporter-associated beta strand repeat-containing protein [Kiritimatiellia bacterium]HRU71493.1 autotransporter-associated beta strand repeat-containing protein [Kiritimatiellia bacterium]
MCNKRNWRLDVFGRRVTPRVMAVATVILWASLIKADTYTWSTATTGAAQDGSGIWNTATANWVGAGGAHAAWNNAHGDTAAFGAGGTAGTVTVEAGGVTIGGLRFNAGVTGSYTLSGGPLTLSGLPIFQLDAPATISSAIIGTPGFIKTGAQALTLTSTNSSFTGDILISQGTLIVNAEQDDYAVDPATSGLGYLHSPRTITVENGATLDFHESDSLGSAGSTPLVTINVRNGATLRNSRTFNTLGTITSTGGATSVYQSFEFADTVTSGGNSSINTQGGSNNGFHLRNNVFAVTGGTLTVSAPLINQNKNVKAGFTKSGDGTMVLAGDNRFTGDVTVSNGVLQVGDGGASGTLGAGAGAVRLVSAGATLVVNRTGTLAVSGPISGNGSVIKQGAGLFLLAGTNSYAGGTTISEGFLAAAIPEALPGFETPGRVTLASGAGLSIGVGSWSSADLMALYDSGVYGPDTYFGFDTTVGNYTYSGQFTVPNVAGIVKTGPNALKLASDTGCAGGVTVIQGILQADFVVGPSATTNITLNGGTLSTAGGSVTSALGTGAGEIEFVPGSDSGFSAVDVPLTVNIGGAAAPLEWGFPAFNVKTLVLNEAGANTNLTLVNGINLNGTTRTVTVSATTPGAEAEISGVIADGSAAAGLEKTGAGTLRLSAANTYSGGTIIGAGTLALAGGDNRLNTAAGISLVGGTLDLGGHTQSITAGSFSMSSGTTLKNGTLAYRNSSWSPGGSVTFAAGGGFSSLHRLLLQHGQTMTLASDAGVTAFGGDGGPNCNFVGVDNGNTNTLTVNGGTLNLTNMANGAGYLRVGINGDATKKPTGVFNVNGGVVNVGHSMSLGTRFDNKLAAAYGEGTFSLSGGEVNIGTGASTATENGCRGWLYLGNNHGSTVSKSTVNLNGGVLSLVQIEGGACGVNTLNLNGGTLRARADNGTFINGGLVCNMDAGGVVIDTAGYDVGISQNLTGSGPLTKRGEGTLVLGGSNAYDGLTSVEAGTLRLSPLAADNVVLHLDASDISTLFENADGTGAITAHGQRVGYWGDKSRSDKPATQSNSSRRPTYVTNAAGFNGLPVLEFDGTDDHITSLLDINPSNLPDMTIIIVYKQLPESGNGGLWGHDNGGWDRMQLFYNGGVYYQIATDSTAATVNGMAPERVTVYTAVLRNGVANGSYVYIDGVSDATHGLRGFTSSDRGGLASLTLAGKGDGDTGYAGKCQIGEVLVYRSALSDTTRRNVEAYLGNKWKGTSDPILPVMRSGTNCKLPEEVMGNLKLWLDASARSSLFTEATGTGAVTQSGEPVGYWGDLSGNAKPATQDIPERCPAYVTNAKGFNGRSVIEFDGVDDDITSLLNINASVMPNITIMMVYQQVAENSNGGLWGHDNGGWDRMQLLNFGMYDGYPIATDGDCTPVKGMNTSDVLVYSAVLKNGVENGSYVYINGVSDATSGLPAFTSREGSGRSTFTLANISPGSIYHGHVRIGEVLVFDTALDETTRSEVEAYLRCKWRGVPGRIDLASGAALDLDGSACVLTEIQGSGTVSNGTLTVTEAFSPAGNTVGTLNVAGATLCGVLLVDVTETGACDCLVGSGNLDLTGLTLQIANPDSLSRVVTYTVATCSGTLTGPFAAAVLPNKWLVQYDYTAGAVSFRYVEPGMVLKLR